MKRLAATLAVCAAIASVVPAARAATDPNAFTKTEGYISSADGTPLQIRVYRPAHATAKTPVILNASPYNGSGGAFWVPPDSLPTGKGIPDPGGFATNEKIFAKGYSLVTLSLRGFGGSGGCFDWGGKGEQSDVKAGIEWAARQAWSTGKVGIIGHSYDGWTGLMALRTKPKGLAAVITESPPSGYLNSYSYGVRNAGGGTAFGAFYAASDLWPPSVNAPTQEWQNALTGSGADPTCYGSVVAGSYDSDRNSSYWKEREAARTAIGTTVPVMFVQGFNDYNVRATNFLPYYPTLKGPRRAVVGPWYHGYSRIGSSFEDSEMAWFDRYLKGAFVPDKPPVQVQDASGRWRTEEDWPPPDARTWTMKLLKGTYANAPGNSGETALPDAIPVSLPFALPTGNGTWTFTQALPYAVRMAGASTLHATISTRVPNVNIVGLVYDVDPKGNAAFVERGAFRAAGSGTYSFDLYPQDWVFAAGHRIGVLLSGADDLWFEPSGLPSQVTVEQATIGIKTIRMARSTAASGPLKARTPYPPFSVADEIAVATLKQTLPPTMATNVSLCNPKDAAWWGTRAAGGGSYGAVAARAAQRSYGLFADAPAVTRALAGRGTRGDVAAHMLNLAAADLGPLFSPQLGLEPSSKLSSSKYNVAVIGDTARAVAYWLSRNTSSAYAAGIADKLVHREGVTCP